MEIEVLVVSPFLQNARILICEETREAVVVDPGDEIPKILSKIKELKVKVTQIWATHAHIDHVNGVSVLKQELKVPFIMHKADDEMLKMLPFQAVQFGLPVCEVPKVDQYVDETNTLSFGKCTCSILHVPGHSPGSIAFLFGKDIISGDALFAGSIGRTDLPGASFPVLKKSILEKLYPLPNDTIVHPGHGPNTTIGHEKQYNPFVSV